MLNRFGRAQIKLNEITVQPLCDIAIVPNINRVALAGDYQFVLF